MKFGKVELYYFYISMVVEDILGKLELKSLFFFRKE